MSTESPRLGGVCGLAAGAQKEGYSALACLVPELEFFFFFFLFFFGGGVVCMDKFFVVFCAFSPRLLELLVLVSMVSNPKDCGWKMSLRKQARQHLRDRVDEVGCRRESKLIEEHIQCAFESNPMRSQETGRTTTTIAPQKTKRQRHPQQHWPPIKASPVS